MSHCPSTATLARLGVGSFEGAAFAALEAHIEDCADCRERLDRLYRNDARTRPDEDECLPHPDHPPEIPGFVIERELGRGGMGVVYQAFQPTLDRRVALKVVRSGPRAGSSDHQRWLEEARAVSSVRHPNVVPLFVIDEANGWLYLVLELIPGGTLERRLDTPYAPRDAAATLLAIAEGVGAIHEKGLAHLDLKPSNILLDGRPDGPRGSAIPRVADLGLARRWGDPDSSPATAGLAGPVGTPSYMAPEQVSGDRQGIDHRADLYGLGAILYHLITGHRPFSAATVTETLDQVRARDPVPPRRLCPTIPRDLETICLTCLHKDPARRYPSSRALADDLRRYLEGRPIAARPVSAAESAWRWCRRRPAVAALVAALLLSIGGGFLGMFVLWRHAVAQRGLAEIERGRAQADFRRAAGLLEQLFELNVGGQDGLPRAVSPEDAISSLWDIRRGIRELGPRLPDREKMYLQLATVNGRLTRALEEQARWDELNPLLDESLREAEAAARLFPRARWVWGWQANDHKLLATIAEKKGDAQALESHLRRALICADQTWLIAPDAVSFSNLGSSRWSLAQDLANRGHREEARALLLAQHRTLEEYTSMLDSETIAAERGRNLLAFHHLGLEPPPRPPAKTTGLPDPLAQLASPAADRLTAREWADLAALALGRQGDRPLAKGGESRVAFVFTLRLQEIAADHRRNGRLDRAIQTVDRYLCFARLVVGRNPDDRVAHLILADAYDQVRKNAHRLNDGEAVEQYSRLEIRENRRALELAPHDEFARHVLEVRESKLETSLHPR